MVTAVGHSVPRRDGASKVTGDARYTDDLVVPGAWYGKTVRSTVARGTIKSIELKAGFDWSREEPILLVAAADRSTLEQAAKPVFDVHEAAEVYTTIEIRNGEALEGMDVGEQLYIEPQGAIAIPGEAGSGKEGSVPLDGGDSRGPPGAESGAPGSPYL